MRSLRIVAVVLAVLVVGFVLAGALLPHRFQVERTHELRAPPERVYPLISSFKNGWPRFSPFGKSHDPALEETFSGPESGAGATESWSGGRTLPGRMVIESADPERGVQFVIEMQGGVRIDGTIEMTRKDGGTLVRWRDDAQLGRGVTAGWLGLVLPSVLGRNLDEALQRLDDASRAPP